MSQVNDEIGEIIPNLPVHQVENDRNLPVHVVEIDRNLAVRDYDCNISVHDYEIELELLVHDDDKVEERIKNERSIPKMKLKNKDDESKEVVMIEDDETKELVMISSDEDGEIEEIIRSPFDDEGVSSVRKSTREEKGKRKLVYDQNPYSNSSEKGDDFTSKVMGTFWKKGKMWRNWISLDRASNAMALKEAYKIMRREVEERESEIELKMREEEALRQVRNRALRRRADSKRIMKFGKEFSYGRMEDLVVESSSSNKKNEISSSSSSIENDDQLKDPFAVALKNIKAQEKSLSMNWIPSRNKQFYTSIAHVPSLVDFSIGALTKHVEHNVSFDHGPLSLKNNISKAVCEYGIMHGQFLKFLMSESPTEGRIRNCSLVTEAGFLEIFQNCDLKKLQVLPKMMGTNEEKLKDMEISTVDGFQSRENEAIIISMAR